MRNSKMLAVAAALSIGGMAAVALPATAQADPVTVQSLASCTSHWANTAYWADCVGGTQTSQVSLGGKCGPSSSVSVWNWSGWYRVNPGQRRTLSAECNVRVWGAATSIRVY